MYADDPQLYIPIRNNISNIFRLEKCISDIKDWMTTNKLKLNEKTEVIILFKKSRVFFSIDLHCLHCTEEEISIPSANCV